MQIDAPALILTVRAHGEHGAIVAALTRDHGAMTGYVRGGRGRTLRPVLLPGNLVQAQFRARTAEQMAGLTVELTESRAAVLGEPLAAAAVQWVTVLTGTVLPEGHSYPRLFEALSGLIGAIAAAPSARGWAAALVQYELLLLAELGYGVDPEQSSLPDSPRGGQAEWAEIHRALIFTGRELAQHFPTERRGDIYATRERLIDRIAELAA